MSQVYLGLYRVDAAGLPRSLEAERLHELSPIEALEDGVAVAAGAGFERYPALYDANRDHLAGPPDVYYPRARDVLKLAADALENVAPIDPSGLRPAYLRQDVAKKPGA
jgi:tRNA threonylcarbamoyladenosine biosynthesis protein TsaB